MTSRRLTRPRAQPRPQAGEENTTGRARGTVAGLRHELPWPLQAPAQPQAGNEDTTGQALTGLPQAQARPQPGDENTTGRARGTLTGLRHELPALLQAPAWPQAGEENTTGRARVAVTELRRALTGPLQAPAQPRAGDEGATRRGLTGPQACSQAGGESPTGRAREALGGLGRAWALAGEPA